MPKHVVKNKDIPKNEEGKTTLKELFLAGIASLIYVFFVWGLAYGNIEAYLDNVEILPGLYFHWERVAIVLLIASIPIFLGVIYLIFKIDK